MVTWSAVNSSDLAKRASSLEDDVVRARLAAEELAAPVADLEIDVVILGVGVDEVLAGLGAALGVDDREEDDDEEGERRLEAEVLPPVDQALERLQRQANFLGGPNGRFEAFAHLVLHVVPVLPWPAVDLGHSLPGEQGVPRVRALRLSHAVDVAAGLSADTIRRMFATQALAARIDRAEARMCAEFAGVAARARPDSRVLTQPLAGGLAVYSGPGAPMNKVIGLGLGDALEASALAEVEAEWAARGEPVRVELSTLDDGAVARLLTSRGYQLLGFENVLG